MTSYDCQRDQDVKAGRVHTSPTGTEEALTELSVTPGTRSRKGTTGGVGWRQQEHMRPPPFRSYLRMHSRQKM